MVEKVKLSRQEGDCGNLELSRYGKPLMCYLRGGTCGDWCPQWELMVEDEWLELKLHCTGREFLFELENGQWVEKTEWE